MHYHISGPTAMIAGDAKDRGTHLRVFARETFAAEFRFDFTKKKLPTNHPSPLSIELGTNPFLVTRAGKLPWQWKLHPSANWHVMPMFKGDSSNVKDSGLLALDLRVVAGWT
jgi:hypothetical protein